MCITFSPDGNRLLLGASNTVVLLDIATGKEIGRFKGHRGPVWSVAFFRDGQRALSGRTSDYTIRQWDLKTGKELMKLQADERVVSLSLSPDERFLVTNDRFPAAVVWDLQTGKRARVVEGQKRKVYGAVYAEKGTQIVTASWEPKGIYVWDAASGNLLRRFGDGEFIHGFAVSPDSRWLLVGGTNQIVFWDLPSGREIKRVVKLEGSAKVAFSVDGRYAVSAEQLGPLRLWEMPFVEKSGKKCSSR
jgi:WD40 repeat protein